MKIRYNEDAEVVARLREALLKKGLYCPCRLHRSAAQMYRAARKSDALLTGAPLPTLFYFALPIILGNIFQQLYSIVDAIVVGKFLGDLPLAGISVAAPIVDVANALVIGGTIGIGVLCAQMCGAEDWTRLRCMAARR